MHEDVIDAYRVNNSAGLNDAEMDALQLLQEDGRMAEIWAGFGQRSLYVLGMVMSCHKRARMVRQKPQMVLEISEEFAGLLAAVTCLQEHFSKHLITTRPMSPKHFDMQFNVAALDRMRAWLREEESVNRHILDRFSPMSQKTNNERDTFGVMLCNELTESFASPHLEQVAVITEVIYSTDDVVSVEALEKRLRRDRRARAKAELMPWQSADARFPGDPDDD